MCYSGTSMCPTPAFATPVLLTFQCYHPQLPACSGLIERIYAMPTYMETPWDSYNSLTLLAIKTVPTVNCDRNTVPGCWSWGVGDSSVIYDNLAAEVRGHPMRMLHSPHCGAWLVWRALHGQAFAIARPSRGPTPAAPCTNAHCLHCCPPPACLSSCPRSSPGI